MNGLRKKKFRNPIKSLKRRTIVGRYDFLPDDPSQSFDDVQLGIAQRENVAEFNLDLDLGESSDSESDNDATPWCSVQYGNGNPDLTPKFAANDPFYFETTFDELPVPNEAHRAVSSYFERSNKPTSTQPRPQHVRSDSDTSKTVDTGESFEDIRKLPKQRSVRFADEEGKAIATVHVTEREEAEVIDGNRVIVLLLSPERKRFEFLHVQYGWEERIQLSEAFKQFPCMASDHCFTKQHFIGLCRPWRGGQELINSLAIQDYDMGQDELLVAIPSGMRSKHIMKLSKPLLANKSVLKTVKRKMKNGFAVQKLQPHAESGENSPERKNSELLSASVAVERVYEPVSLRQSVGDASMVAESGAGVTPLNKINYVVSSREGEPAVDDNERVENVNVSLDLMDEDDQSVTETTSVVTVDDPESVPDMDRYFCAKQKDDEDSAKGVMTVEEIIFASSDSDSCGQVAVVNSMEKVTQARERDKSRFRLFSASIVAAGFLYQIVPGKKRLLHKKRSSRAMTEV